MIHGGRQRYSNFNCTENGGRIKIRPLDFSSEKGYVKVVELQFEVEDEIRILNRELSEVRRKKRSDP